MKKRNHHQLGLRFSYLKGSAEWLDTLLVNPDKNNLDKIRDARIQLSQALEQYNNSVGCISTKSDYSSNYVASKIISLGTPLSETSLILLDHASNILSSNIKPLKL